MEEILKWRVKMKQGTSGKRRTKRNLFGVGVVIDATTLLTGLILFQRRARFSCLSFLGARCRAKVTFIIHTDMHNSPTVCVLCSPLDHLHSALSMSDLRNWHSFGMEKHSGNCHAKKN